MVQSIIPRPVAWVLTRNENGSFNLAPFSFFNGVSSDPPLVSLSIGLKRNGSPKDTLKNLNQTGNCNIFIAGFDQMQAVNCTGSELDYGDSEIDKIGARLESYHDWNLPLIKGIKLAFECQLFEIITRQEFKQSLVLLRITKMMIDDHILSSDGSRLKIDASSLNPLCRLGGNEYSFLGGIETAME